MRAMQEAYAEMIQHLLDAIVRQDVGHGPYWYAYARKAGRLTSAYIGKDVGKFTLG